MDKELPPCEVAASAMVVSDDALSCRSAVLLTLDEALRKDPRFYQRVPGVITGRHKAAAVKRRVEAVRTAPITTRAAGRQAERAAKQVRRDYERDGGKLAAWGDGTFLEWLMENLPRIIEQFMAIFAACGI